jgi:ankyrin repeat protein
MTMSEELARAAFDGDTKKVAKLLDAGAPINAKGRNWTPLHAAIENDQYDCVELLIARGADIHEVWSDFPPLAHAVDIAIDGTIQSGGSQGDESIEVIQLLLKHGASPVVGLDVARAYKSDKVIKLLEAATF